MAGPAALPLLLVFGIVGLVVVGIVVVATSPTRNRSRRHSGGSTTSPIANYQPKLDPCNDVVGTEMVADRPSETGRPTVNRRSSTESVTSILDINLSDVIRRPRTWVGTELLVTVDEAAEEYRNIADLFLSSLGAIRARVLQVSRIQNKTTYQRYMVYRKQIARKLNKEERAVERRLWHGTEVNRVESIANQKFDRGYAGVRRKNGFSSLGKGCYFAVKSEYSARDGYATANEQGERVTFLVRVVVGAYCRGKEGLRAPRARSQGGNYDSVVDSRSNPTMCAVFDDFASYPEYLIKYKTFQ